MDFPRYWAKGSARDLQNPRRSQELLCWGWSNESIEEAQTRGEGLALNLLERFRRGEFDQLKRGYGYPDRPVREEVIERMGDSTVLSRNRYGATVLNSSCVMFVDVDFPPDDNDLFKKFKQLVSREKKVSAENLILHQLDEWLKRNPAFGFRVYRTRGGLRYLATHQEFTASAPETQTLLESLASDPLYRRLCKSQDCFRARLTPKPWRMGMANPPYTFPYETTKAQSKMSEWLTRYEDKSQKFATCQFLGQMGSSTSPSPEIQKVVDLHDRTSCSMTPERSLA